MWIETEIGKTFTTKAGNCMVSFTAKREDGRNWAAPERLVIRCLGGEVQTGLAVRIEVDGERVTRIQRSRNSPIAASQKVAVAQSPSHTGAKSQAAKDEAIRTAASALPYGFISIDLNRSVMDTPVWHDGSSGGELLSGEILCTLESLTPLLPGNMRYEVSEADQQKLKVKGLADKKQIAEPLRLPDRRVVIAGSALKGMIRHSLGALLSAPMERVAERHYSYRPNLDFNVPGAIERYVVRPALITAAKNGGWTIDVFNDARAALFVRKDAENVIQKAAQNGVVSGTVVGVKQEEIPRRDRPPKKTNHLIPSPGTSMSFTNSHRLAIYKGGIDGKGLLAVAFNKKDDETAKGCYACKKANPHNCRGPFTYDLALAPLEPSHQLEITAQLYRQYLQDQEKVLSNNEIGHLTAHPLEFDVDQVARTITTQREFQPGQLIYVELTTDKAGKVTNNSKVVSCGHHFRYRWAYTSSVRTKAGQPRACLTPSACERVPAERNNETDVPPERLTGARLLFGYVRDDDNPIGRGVYERLAGRIAVNHAVSVGVPRFLGEKEGYCVPLKILGQPKPSAWEFYLQQPQNAKHAPATYGDLPGDPGGELKGRKFYRHQPSVKKMEQIRDQENIHSDQATLARFICAPETKFKFTVRFARLREWELGAVLAVLQPHRLVDGGKPEDYAHKLGLGRPLGMGSVCIEVDKLRLRKEREIELRENDGTTALSALNAKLAGSDNAGWLNLHRFKDEGRLYYPLADTKVEGKWVKTIYAWHTNLRREYSKLRRERDPNWAALHDRIRL